MDNTDVAGIVTALNSNFPATSVISTFTQLLPWIGAIAVAVLAVTMAKRALKGASKGRVRM